MTLYRDTGVVLRVQKLGEADRIITLITRRNGKLRAVAKGVRRTSSRFGARLEPFCHVDVQCYTSRTPCVTRSGSSGPSRPLTRDNTDGLRRSVSTDL
ncbi:DNA repair protein RecO, partial [Kibdelosporangium lantanae]